MPCITYALSRYAVARAASHRSHQAWHCPRPTPLLLQSARQEEAPVELRQLLHEVVVLQQHRAAVAHRHAVHVACARQHRGSASDRKNGQLGVRFGSMCLPAALLDLVAATMSLSPHRMPSPAQLLKAQTADRRQWITGIAQSTKTLTLDGVALVGRPRLAVVRAGRSFLQYRAGNSAVNECMSALCRGPCFVTNIPGGLNLQNQGCTTRQRGCTH